METADILVHSLNRFSLCTKMAVVAVAKLLLAVTSYANALYGRILNGLGIGKYTVRMSSV